MDILYISKTSVLDGGGSEKKANQLTKRLANRGHDITILAAKTDPTLDRKMTDHGRELHHVRCVPEQLLERETLGFYLPRYLFVFMSFPLLLWLFFDRDFDVVMEDMTPYPTLTSLPAKVLSVPIVVVQHEFFDENCYQVYDPLTATIQLLLQNVLRIVDFTAIIVPTTHVKQQFVDYGIPEERLHVLVNGIDTKGYHQPRYERDNKQLIVVSRLTKRKRHGQLLRAVAQLRKSGTNVELHIVGTGPEGPVLRQLAEQLDLRSVVTFHGYVEKEVKIRLLNESGLFIFASRQEGLGNVLLEAMAAGSVVVARHLPVYDDFLTNNENGILLDDDEPEQFATAIDNLISSPKEMEKIRESGLKTAKQLTWESYTDEAESILNDAVVDESR